MNKEEFTNRTATGGLFPDDRKLLVECFDEEGNIDSEAFMEHTLMMLQAQTILRIQHLNKQIADAIREFELEKQWTNLHQIFRSLPDSIAGAARGTTFEDEVKEWANQWNEFLSLGTKDRKRALEKARNDLPIS